MHAEGTGFFEIRDLAAKRVRNGKAYLEFLRIPSMSAGLYVLPAGAEDTQIPHKQDELYYVVRGKARMRAGAEDREVAGGTTIFVAANVEHRFHHIEEELEILVFFAPAETE